MMVIVLLVISVLALSIGEQSVQQTVPEPEPEPVEQPIPPAPSPSDVEIRTVGGQDITAATAFLLCKAGVVEQFDPVTRSGIRSWSLDSASPAQIAADTGSSNIYIAVAGSCFPSLPALVEGLRRNGTQLGYEPVPEEAVLPWQ